MNKREKVICIYPRYVWADNAEGKKEYDIYHQYKDKPIGTRTYADAGAPGVGHIIHEITHIDATGIYGFVVENTMRMMDPSECI
jgi:hypothetical protein